MKKLMIIIFCVYHALMIMNSIMVIVLSLVIQVVRSVKNRIIKMFALDVMTHLQVNNLVYLIMNVLNVPCIVIFVCLEGQSHKFQKNNLLNININVLKHFQLLGIYFTIGIFSSMCIVIKELVV